MKKNFTNYYSKMITFFLLLSMLPVIIVGLFSYFKSSEMIQTNVAQEKQNSLYQMQTNVEQTLKTVDHSLTNYVTSSQLRQTLREPLTTYQFQLYNEVKEELNHLQTFDTGIEDILLVSLEENWLINNNGLQRISKEQFNELNKNYLSLPRRSAWIFEKKSKDLFNPYFENTCPNNISLVKKLPLNSTHKTGMAIATLPTCKFKNIVSQQLDSEKIVILDKDLQVIEHSDPTKIGEDFSKLDYLSFLDDAKPVAGQMNTTIDQTEYKVTYSKSDYNHWVYLSIIKINDLNKQSRSIGWFTFLISTSLLLLSFILSFIGSRRIYKPIQKLYYIFLNNPSHKSDMKHDNEFELIERQINHILDENVQLEDKLHNQIIQLKQFFIVKLLQGKISEEELPSKLASFNFKQDWKRLCIFTLQIDTFEDTEYKAEEEDLLLFTINTMIEELVPTNERFTPIVMNQTQVTIMLSNHEKDKDYAYYMNSLAEEIQSKVKRELNLPVSIGISLPFHQLTASDKAYKEGLEALKYRIKTGPESIIFFENLERTTTFHTFFPKQIENEIFDAIKVYDHEKVDEGLNKLLTSIFEKDLNHTHYHIFMIRFFNDLIELMQTMGIELIEIDYKKPFFDQLYELKSMEEIQNWFKEIIIYPLMKKIEERTESQYKNLSEKIIHIIQQEYDIDITLESIATRLHYNPNYLSSIFRKETNYSFSEYLSLYRLNIAKQWLIETEMSVKEIAERLKYTNSQNFIRSFRKNEGTTPGKYRNMKKAQ